MERGESKLRQVKENPILQHQADLLKEVYQERRNRKKKELTVQYASLFVQQRFNLRDLASLVGRETFSSHLYKMIRQHVDAGLAGKPYEIHMIQTRKRKDYEDGVAFAVGVIIDNCDGQSKGRDVHYDTGEATPLPASCYLPESIR